MICIKTEKLIAISDIPAWCEKTIGNRVSKSTAYRWYLRGIRGVKLETILVGGQRFTSLHRLENFFLDSTKSAEHEPENESPITFDARNVNRAEEVLSDDGM